MKDNTKKRLVIAGLAAVCALSVFGISRVLYKEPEQELRKENRAEEETELVVETEDTGGGMTDDTKSSEEETGLVIEPEQINSTGSWEQAIQPAPEQTEEKKPEEPPALPEDAQVTDPEGPPSYAEAEEEEAPSPADTAPATGDSKDGMVYVEGFGWLPDAGEGTGTSADNMYENGNKVGIMD